MLTITAVIVLPIPLKIKFIKWWNMHRKTERHQVNIDFLYQGVRMTKVLEMTELNAGFPFYRKGAGLMEQAIKKDFQLMLASKFLLLAIGSLVFYSYYIHSDECT